MKKEPQTAFAGDSTPSGPASKVETAKKGMGAWRPIEESNYPARSILVWCPKNRNIHNVWWDSHNGTLGSWRIFGSIDFLNEEPTHWMPLPDPPTE